jgi:hypothetical protein
MKQKDILIIYIHDREMNHGFSSMILIHIFQLILEVVLPNNMMTILITNYCLYLLVIRLYFLWPSCLYSILEQDKNHIGKIVAFIWLKNINQQF